MAKAKKIVLFNYGGGIRGLIPAHLMTHIEDKTGLRMVDMVDLFSGPSTGAILNSAMNIPHPHHPDRPKYRARHMVKFYEREGHKIFPADGFRDFRSLLHDFNNRTMRISKLKALMRHGHYDPTHMGNCMKRLLGDTQMSESLRSLIIPVFNIDGASLNPVIEDDENDDTPVHTRNNVMDGGGYAVWLKSIKPDMSPRRPTPQVSLFDAVMGSTAAPTYFPCHNFEAKFQDERGNRDITAIDGSIFDNPCISYHGAMRQHLKDDDDTVMITLGTGHTLKSIHKDAWNSYGNLGVVDPANDLPLINILFHAPESALTESFHDELGERIYSFNKSLLHCDETIKPSPQIDDARPGNLKLLNNFAGALIEEHADQFDDLCELLVSNYELKQKTADEEAREKRSFFSFFRT